MRAYALQQSPDNCRSFNPGARVVSRAAKCLNGKAGEYPCSGVDLLDMITHSELQSNPAVGGGEGSDVWGWEYNGREFGIITQTDSTAFVEIDIATGAMRYLGRLNTQTTSALWRDAKTIGNYVYIGSEAANHGIQVFDLVLDDELDEEIKTSTAADGYTNLRLERFQAHQACSGGNLAISRHFDRPQPVCR